MVQAVTARAIVFVGVIVADCSRNARVLNTDTIVTKFLLTHPAYSKFVLDPLSSASLSGLLTGVLVKESE